MHIREFRDEVQKELQHVKGVRRVAISLAGLLRVEITADASKKEVERHLPAKRAFPIKISRITAETIKAE